MALWEPNKYWFAPDGRGGVAYQQHGNVALTLAGPFGPAAFHEETAAGFIRYCAEHALIPCFYSCTDELWPMLQGRGFRRVAVAQETRLAVRSTRVQGQGMAKRPHRPEPGREDRRAARCGAATRTFRPRCAPS